MRNKTSKLKKVRLFLECLGQSLQQQGAVPVWANLVLQLLCVFPFFFVGFLFIKNTIKIKK